MRTSSDSQPETNDIILEWPDLLLPQKPLQTETGLRSTDPEGDCVEKQAAEEHMGVCRETADI